MSPLPGIYASQILGHLFTLSGSYDALASVTVPSGGLSSVTFAGIPNTYSHLQIRCISRGSGTGAALKGTFMNINSDSSTTVPNHALYGDGSSSYASYSSDTRINLIPQTVPSSSATSNVYSVMIMDFFDYTNTNKYKTIRALTGADTNGGGIIGLVSAMWQNTNAITSISIGTNEPYVQYSQISLYGIK
jgi:hypothetical protein